MLPTAYANYCSSVQMLRKIPSIVSIGRKHLRQLQVQKTGRVKISFTSSSLQLVCVCVISMLGGHRGFHFRHYCPSSKLLPAFPQGVAITSLCFAARGNRVLLSYTAPDLRLSGSVPRKRGAACTRGLGCFSPRQTAPRPRTGTVSTRTRLLQLGREIALPAFLPTAPSKQLGRGVGFEPSTFQLLARHLIPYTN